MNTKTTEIPGAAGNRIAEADIRCYEDDGVVCLRGLFNEDWVERLREATARSMVEGGVENGPDGAARFHSNMFMWRTDPDFRAFVFESPAAQIAKELMRSKEVRFYFDHLFVKEAGAQSPTPWHHDQPYWPVRGEQVCSIWVGLDPVTLESSGLEYVKGSHRWGRRFDPAAFNDRRPEIMAMLHDGENEVLPDIDANRSQYQFLSWQMEPGDCLVHHSMAVHGASGNSSTKLQRRALSTRWIGDDAVYWPLPNMKQESRLSAPALHRGDKLIDDERFPLIAR